MWCTGTVRRTAWRSRSTCTARHNPTARASSGRERRVAIERGARPDSHPGYASPELLGRIDRTHGNHEHFYVRITRSLSAGRSDSSCLTDLSRLTQSPPQVTQVVWRHSPAAWQSRTPGPIPAGVTGRRRAGRLPYASSAVLAQSPSSSSPVPPSPPEPRPSGRSTSMPSSARFAYAGEPPGRAGGRLWPTAASGRRPRTSRRVPVPRD